MSKKKMYIILAVILSVFIIAMIVITVIKLRNNNDTAESSSISENYYAKNDVKDKSSVAEEIVKQKTVDNVVYNNFDKLNVEQRAAKDGLIKLVKSAVKTNESTHGDAIQAEILDKSNNYYAFVNVTFLDDYSEEYVLIYDDINTHSYLNCVTLALYESINGKIT